MVELVGYRSVGGVGTLTLDSPHNRNALSAPLQTQLNAGLRAALADPAVRVVVLTGTGPVFCSGADLAEQRAGNALGPELMIDTLTRLWDSPKPVVCRVNGHARAGGLGLVSACDIAVAPDTATFGFAEVRIGALPAMIAVTCLPRLAPRAALELFLTGENVTAARAAEVGLVNRAVPGDALDDEVARYVDMLRRGGPLALAGIKPMIRRIGELPLERALTEMAELSRRRFRSAEVAEGLAAFADKRDPSWVVD